MNPQPFPWHLVDRTTRESVRAIGDAHRWLAHRDASERVLARVRELVRSPMTLRVRSATIGAPAPRAGFAAVAFTIAESDDHFAVVVESALAASLITRAMRRSSPRVVDPKRAAPVALAGAFGAFVVAAFRASGADPIRITWCGDAGDLSLAELPARIVDVNALVLVEHDAFEAHLLASEDTLRRSPNRLFSSADLATLGQMPIPLSIVASAATVSHRELRALAVGDTWLPGSFLSRTSNGKSYVGDVALASPATERGVRARLGEDGALVVVNLAEEVVMTADDRVVENAGEAPVVVRVEVGAVTLRAREWAALRSGDVIATGQRISEPVVLRVGGVEVARGELVDVEGEIGVRILSRT